MSVGSAGCESSRRPCSAPGTAGSHGHGGGAAPRMGPASLVLPGAGRPAACSTRGQGGCRAALRSPNAHVRKWLHFSERKREVELPRRGSQQLSALTALCQGLAVRVDCPESTNCPALLCQVRSGRAGCGAFSSPLPKAGKGQKPVGMGFGMEVGSPLVALSLCLGSLFPRLAVTLVALRLKSCRRCPGLWCHGAGAVGRLLGALLRMRKRSGLPRALRSGDGPPFPRAPLALGAPAPTQGCNGDGVPCGRLVTTRSTTGSRRACRALSFGLSSGWRLWGDRDVPGGLCSDGCIEGAAQVNPALLHSAPTWVRLSVFGYLGSVIPSELPWL